MEWIRPLSGVRLRPVSHMIQEIKVQMNEKVFKILPFGKEGNSNHVNPDRYIFKVKHFNAIDLNVNTYITVCHFLSKNAKQSLI